MKAPHICLWVPNAVQCDAPEKRKATFLSGKKHGLILIWCAFRFSSSPLACRLLQRL